MGTPEQDNRLKRLEAMLDQGLITAAEFDRMAAGLGIKAAVKSKTAKAKGVVTVLGYVTLGLGVVADAAHVFYPQLSGPLVAAGKLVSLIGSWF